MDPKSQRVKLNDGHFTPVLGFGTYAPEEVPKSEALEATKFAIEVGFRHVDSAHLYQNEEQVGQAIRSKIADGTVRREDIFYTSKLWCNSLQPELVRPALEKSLQNLQLDYVDLYIIHSPVSLKPGNKFVPKDESGKLIFDSVDLCQTWEALEKCKDAGLTKSIGVSNFNHKQLEKILNKPGLKYKPVCNQPARLLCPWHSPDKNTGVDCHALLQGIFLTQGSNLHLSHWQGGSLQLAPPGKPPHLFLQDRVECHPYLNQSKLLEFCKSHDIVLVAYAALGAQLLSEWVNSNNPVLLEDTVLCAIAKKHKQTPALVALRYQIQRGVVVLAKSFNKKRIKENMQVFDFELTPEDMKAIDGLNRNIRYYDFQQGIGHPEYPFSEEY
ncbi:prostaglandin F synthase 1 isoform X1 [Bubalus bubalis]|uniref:prostaglandin F synthase 1 isoform X1 n=1 Tax=Bubalus bubalis TaxID=89462 RepID=UPI001E1B7EEB|nr:prostaglandin F synthase 1 isoform X1 [Bubalus bubalis]